MCVSPYKECKFQSTPPVKAATRADIIRDFTARFQSTPPVKAATSTNSSNGAFCLFQSTPPVKAATLFRKIYLQTGQISIHAAREGGDVSRKTSGTNSGYFNPRRP